MRRGAKNKSIGHGREVDDRGEEKKDLEETFEANLHHGISALRPCALIARQSCITRAMSMWSLTSVHSEGKKRIRDGV